MLLKEEEVFQPLLKIEGIRKAPIHAKQKKLSKAIKANFGHDNHSMRVLGSRRVCRNVSSRPKHP